jgi:hypothetical protein
MLTSLRDIKGVGEKVRAELISAYGSEARALRSFASLRFYELFSSSVAPAKQVEIAREIFSRVTGVEYADILATPEARQIYAQVLEALRKEACTSYAKAKLSLFYPVASENSLEVLRRDVALGVKLAKALGAEKLREVRRLLKGMGYPKTPRNVRVASQVLAVEDEELYQELSSKYRGIIEVLLVESPEDLEALRSFELVRYIQGSKGYASMLGGAANAEVFPDFSEPEALPELTLSFFEENLSVIETCAEVLAIVGEERLRLIGKEHLSGEELARIAERIKRLKEDENPYAYASANFALLSEACVEEANREVERRVEKRGVAIRGAEMLDLLARISASPGSYLPEELREVIAEVAEEYEAKLAERLRLSSEALRFAGLFSVSYPIELNPERSADVEAWLSAEASRRSFAAKRELAVKLASKVAGVKRSVELALELDYLLALGSFSLRYSATQAKVSEAMRLRFVNARHLLLSASSQPQPVSYELGFNSKRIAVITGANSGGKTTLLETIAQVQIMAQSGLPVLAESAEVPLLQKLYFFAKRRGESGAGAFESLLRSFAGIAASKAERRLILADEIEAVTEPGAAAKIIAAMLEWFSRDSGTLVAIVTHLGEELLSLGLPSVRIDGIEAKGLDENLNLIVDRNPVLGKLARSTPELILERLSRKSGEEFYTFLLRRFRAEG